MIKVARMKGLSENENSRSCAPPREEDAQSDGIPQSSNSAYEDFSDILWLCVWIGIGSHDTAEKTADAVGSPDETAEVGSS